MTHQGLGFDLFSPLQFETVPVETRFETFVPFILAAGALGILGFALWMPGKKRKRR